MSTATRPATPSGVYRIRWVPGTDRLLGVCYCGAEREFEDPLDAWDWLLTHPGALHTAADRPAPHHG
ncbi:hypothetical protein [Streptomyces sp. NPDC050560]|uniref:hypothetical protein n=1 Tax=Streptomyces sp. NPDC050560 TaxID=3365630 RepID=UPI00379F5786